jgi:hypothetical protein
LAKDKDSDLLAESHNILNRQRNYISHVLNVHRIRDFRQIEICTAEKLVAKPSLFGIETAIEKLKIINCQVLIKVRQNLFKQDTKHYVLGSIHSLIIF